MIVDQEYHHNALYDPSGEEDFSWSGLLQAYGDNRVDLAGVRRRKASKRRGRQEPDASRDSSSPYLPYPSPLSMSVKDCQPRVQQKGVHR